MNFNLKNNKIIKITLGVIAFVMVFNLAMIVTIENSKAAVVVQPLPSDPSAGPIPIGIDLAKTFAIEAKNQVEKMLKKIKDNIAAYSFKKSLSYMLNYTAVETAKAIASGKSFFQPSTEASSRMPSRSPGRSCNSARHSRSALS